jgi:DNA topoisomerase-1
VYLFRVMNKPLVIVESPAKAKTISRFLGKDFVVESSIGHIRDLPRSAADIPKEYKGSAWARIGVDVDNDFRPLYIITTEKKQQVKKLKDLIKSADELYLATDEDREGESIAWHLLEVLQPKIPVRRMVFHEITQSAIQDAVQNSRDVDQRLVDAQETRRILDRLVGYEVSPVLWKKVQRGLSAGRVQSVATRLLVERERARMRFRTANYWDIEAILAKDVIADLDTPGSFAATLISLDGKRLATGKDFGEDGKPSREDVVVLTEETSHQLVASLESAAFSVRSVEEKPFKRSPYAPFITSTLQQEAGRKLRFSAARTMQAAQRLYENGHITYMRTDSTTLSEQALSAARSSVTSLYGKEFLPEQARRYEKKVKNAQEAHEAIRPAGDTWLTPDQLSKEVGNDEAKVYELIWKRTVASQMTDATGKSLQVRVGATTSTGDDAEFAASGKTITFPGFLRAYVEGADDPEAELEDREVHLPPLAVGDELEARELTPQSHDTQPPARYTEASLVKALEEMGIGRPSTYASIISTIQNRGYVWKRGTALVPSFVAFAVVSLLEQHFSELVDYGFTASMEDVLDNIAGGEVEPVPWLKKFYFGNGVVGLKEMVSGEHFEAIDARGVNSIPLGTDDNGESIVIRIGRYGPYVERGEERAAIPPELAPDEATVEKAVELLTQGSNERELGTDPESGQIIYAKAGRYGPYVQVGDGSDGEKPKTASIFKSMDLGALTLEQALELLKLPRVVGVHPDDGEEITAQNGRFGPYLKKGTDSRSLETEEQLFTITLDQALAIYAQPKTRRGQRGATAPLKEFGNDPETGKPMVIKDGRFGPYITDGETNVTVPRGETIDTITAERAADLLAEKRAKGPVKKRTKKAAAKKSAKKTTKKKAAAKKSNAKKVEEDASDADAEETSA